MRLCQFPFSVIRRSVSIPQITSASSPLVIMSCHNLHCVPLCDQLLETNFVAKSCREIFHPAAMAWQWPPITNQQNCKTQKVFVIGAGWDTAYCMMHLIL